MKVRFISEGEFEYSKFPTAQSVFEWLKYYYDIDPEQVKLQGEQTSWRVEWLQNQFLSPQNLLDNPLERM